MKVFHFWCFLIILISSVFVESKLTCMEAGSCVKCLTEELESEYCKATNRKMKISCTEEDETVVEDYKSCHLTAEDDQLRLVIFQIIMALVGGLAYWGVQVRKANSASLFDNRKMRSVLHYINLSILFFLL